MNARHVANLVGALLIALVVTACSSLIRVPSVLPGQPMEDGKLRKVLEQPVDTGKGNKAATDKRIDDRAGTIRDLEGQLAALKTQQAQDRRYAEELEAYRIAAIMYWISGILALGAVICGVLSFIPTLMPLAGTLRGIATGLVLFACLAYGAAPLLAYLKWIVGSLVLLGGVGAAAVIWKTHKVSLVAKVSSHAADILEKVDPTDSEAIGRAHDEIRALQAKFGIAGLTETLRKRTIVAGLADKGWALLQRAKRHS